MSNAALLAEIAARARDALAGRDAGHDELHIERVLRNARALLAAERAAGRVADAFVVEAACWLHDLVLLPKGTGPAGESARRSAAAARALLAGLGVGAAMADAVAHAVETHSYSGGLRPDTLEGAIVQDADRLDALGAVGAARFWVMVGELGSRLYHPTDPLGRGRELDDRAYALDHIARKLLKLPDLMNTAAGRAEAERRAAFLCAYRDQFLREIGAGDVAESG